MGRAGAPVSTDGPFPPSTTCAKSGASTSVDCAPTGMQQHCELVGAAFEESLRSACTPRAGEEA
eukprot:15440090-Alexandrium_andersonii.AAC.1